MMAVALNVQLMWRQLPKPALLLGVLILANALVIGWLLPAAAAHRQDVAIANSTRELPSEPSALLSGDTPSARLKTFQQVLGDRQAGQAQRALFALAAQSGLQLDEAHYERRQDASGLFQELHVTLPLSGSYPAVRQFVEQLLLALPYAALDKIVFKRDNAAADTVTASLTVVLLLQPEPAGASLARSPSQAGAGVSP